MIGTMYLQSASIGDGYRLVVVARQARKWATLVNPSTCLRVKVPLEDLRRLRPEPTVKPRKLARRMKERRKYRVALGLAVCAREVHDQAMAALAGMQAA